MIAGAAIRRADILEAQALSELGAATFVETFSGLYRPKDLNAFLTTEHSVAYYEAYLGHASNAAWVAESDDGYLLGYATAGPCDLPIEPMPDRAGQLKRIYLLKEAQGLGLGKALLQKAISWLETGFDDVFLSVFSENFSSQEFYRRQGFEKVGEFHFMVGNQADLEWIMKKTASKG